MFSLFTVRILGASSYETRRANDTASILVPLHLLLLLTPRSRCTFQKKLYIRTISISCTNRGHQSSNDQKPPLGYSEILFKSTAQIRVPRCNGWLMVWLHQDQTSQTKSSQTEPDQKMAGSIWLPAPEVCRKLETSWPDWARQHQILSFL